MKRSREVAVSFHDESSNGSITDTSSDDSGCGCSGLFSFSRGRKRAPPTEGELQISQDLNNLTLNERNTIFEEIHGVANANTLSERDEEDPAFWESKSRQLREEMGNVKKAERAAYDLAMFLRPEYVKEAELEAMCLRAEMHDPAKAAKRLALHFAVKLEMFGINRLVKDICWKDLTADDKNSLLIGASQTYPELRDRRGRAMWIVNLAQERFVDNESHLRCAWYEAMNTVIGNPAAQKHGLVGVMFMIGAKSDAFSTSFAVKATRMTNAIPFRYAALHICYDNPALKPALNIVQLLLHQQSRMRFRGHYGSYTECLYELLPFGLGERMPVQNDGLCKTDDYFAALEDRWERERLSEAPSTETCVPYPLENDVLFGKGKLYGDFPGNQRLHNLVNRYADRYVNSNSNDEKTLIAETIMYTVKEAGGRFLKHNNKGSGWLVVTDTMIARDKVSQTIRTKLRGKR